MISDVAELKRIFRAEREAQGIEFKASMSWQDLATRGKVIRAALAMANKRDGGVLAFGAEQGGNKSRYKMVGLPRTAYESFTQDDVVSTVNAHATPHIDLTVEHLEIDGRLFVAVVVREFADYPIICAKDYVIDGQSIVTRGKLYCRSRRMPETTEVQSPDDMREIIELATAKGLERYFKLREIERRVKTDPEDRFRKQLRDLE